VLSSPRNGDAVAKVESEPNESMPSSAPPASSDYRVSTSWIVVGVVALLVGLFFGLVMSSVGS
jgi:hypothetical protein